MFPETSSFSDGGVPRRADLCVERFFLADLLFVSFFLYLFI